MTELSLSGLHVLVTRPVPQQQELVDAIKSASGEVLHMPLIAIKALSDPAATTELIPRIQNLDHYHILIFVSTNAVRHGVEWIDRYWPQFPQGITLVAVGPGTARLLASELEQDVIYSESGMTSEHLLQLPLFADIVDKRIGILRGQGGRELLAQTLRKNGARVDYLEVYQRQLVPYQPDQFVAQCQASNINVLTVSSGESLLHLANLIRDNKAGMSLIPLLVPSQRLADQARQAGFMQVVNTGGADVPSFMAALGDLARKVPESGLVKPGT